MAPSEARRSCMNGRRPSICRGRTSSRRTRDSDSTDRAPRVADVFGHPDASGAERGKQTSCRRVVLEVIDAAHDVHQTEPIDARKGGVIDDEGTLTVLFPEASDAANLRALLHRLALSDGCGERAG